MLALTVPMTAQAQNQGVNAPTAATSTAPPGKEVATGEIVITGIRASLRSSREPKRKAEQIVDARIVRTAGFFRTHRTLEEAWGDHALMVI